MISFLQGRIHTLGTSYVDLFVHGVGYRVYIPVSWLGRMEPGQELFIYTYQAVREDAIMLFGFESEEDRNWFELLIGVSGIGPKGAMQILSGISGAEFAEAIYAEDTNALCGLPGVGKKTAQRLVIELKDKIEQLWTVQAITARSRVTAATSYASQLERDVVEALVSLGYNERQAVEQVREVFGEEQPPLRLEDALRLCLQRLSR